MFFIFSTICKYHFKKIHKHMAANTKMVDMALLHLPNVMDAQCLLHHTVRGLQRQDDSRVWRDQIRRNVHEGLLWLSTRPAAAATPVRSVPFAVPRESIVAAARSKSPEVHDCFDYCCCPRHQKRASTEATSTS